MDKILNESSEMNISYKLWNKDFSLVVVCQAIVLFCNMTLSFALAYHVLAITESSAVFGMALGLPYISLLVLSPIGGIIADRLRKQRIMFWLDVLAIILILTYMAISGLIMSAIPIVFVKLLALNAIQGAYMPAIQAAVPVLIPSDKLTTGNAVVGIVNTLANMAGPALAAVSYARFGLYPILIFCAVCYVVTAITDLFIRIPHQKQLASESISSMVKNDMALAIRFITKEKPVIVKLSVVLFLFTMLNISLFLVGLPVLITQNLGMDMSLMGASQALMMAGGLLGGIVAGAFGTRLTIKKYPLFLLIATVVLVPMGLIFLVGGHIHLIFGVITAAGVVVMFMNTLIVLVGVTFIQRETPSELLGKVMSVIMMTPFLATALGQMIFGVVFEQLADYPWITILGTAALLVVVVMYSRFVASGK